MVRMIKWPSIEQFRNVIRTVTAHTRFAGKDENGDAVYDHTKPLPTLTFEGTVKLHGTNAAVGITPAGELWFQSRENIITPEKDNAGFAMFAFGAADKFKDIATRVVTQWDSGNDTSRTADAFTSVRDLLIFGEWCGGNIQKGVAISGLPKMFVVFGIAFVDAEGNKTYLNRAQVEDAMVGFNPSHPGNIFCIYSFPSFKMEIDFEKPEMFQNELNRLTIGVEERCPVGAAMGQEGVGEGIVWRCINDGYSDSGFWFKVKGEKHSASKVKTLAPVDEEKVQRLNDLAMKVCPAWRLEQMLQSTFDTLNGGVPDIKRTGDYIKNVMADIFKEEMDIIAESGFTGKELSAPVSKITRQFLMEHL